MEKVFVKVRCSHLPDGTIRPESLEWEDGQVWEITRTIHVAAPADHEFEGIRYLLLGRNPDRDQDRKQLLQMISQLSEIARNM